ncbi:MAG: hypothetical protein QOF76_688 [Solirubrobacteraceae bacterium]|nr:hypothetical protein [Solirubrobacteraceae bacterium]
MSSITAASLKDFPARYYAAWNGRDIGVLEEIVAPEFSWIDPLLPEELTEYEGARMFFQGAWQGFPDIAFEPIGEPLVDESTGRVAGEWRMTGTHTGEGFPPGAPASGKPFDVKGTDVWTIGEDGRAVAVRAYYDSATLARQLGLA